MCTLIASRYQEIKIAVNSSCVAVNRKDSKIVLKIQIQALDLLYALNYFVAYINTKYCAEVVNGSEPSIYSVMLK